MGESKNDYADVGFDDFATPNIDCGVLGSMDMANAQKEFRSAIIEGKRIAATDNRAVLVGWSWRQAVWFVDTDSFHADVRILPQFVDALTTIGRRKLATL